MASHDNRYSISAQSEHPITEDALYEFIADYDYKFIEDNNIVDKLNAGIREAAVSGYSTYDLEFIIDDYESAYFYTPEAIERILDRIVALYEDSNLCPDWAFYQDNYHITFEW